MTDMTVSQLLESEGLDPEELLGWARERAAALLEQIDRRDLEQLLEGLAVPNVELGHEPSATVDDGDAVRVTDVVRVTRDSTELAAEDSVRALVDSLPDNFDSGPIPSEQAPNTTEDIELDEVELIGDDELELVEEDGQDGSSVYDGDDEVTGLRTIPDEPLEVDDVEEPTAPVEVGDDPSAVPQRVIGSDDPESDALEVSEEIDLSDLDDL